MAFCTVRRRVADPVSPGPAVEEPKARKRISVRAAKQKGKDFENQIATMLQVELRLPESDIKRARAGNRESDIQLSDEARRRFPYHLECKNEKTIKTHQWIKQMEEDLQHHRKKGIAYQGGMVVFKEHGNKTPYALIRFDQLLRLIVEKKR